MSKKLDEIIENIPITDESFAACYRDDVAKALKEAYIAGRDETVDFLVKTALIKEEVTSDYERDGKQLEEKVEYHRYGGGYIRDENYVEVDEESILAAKTEESLQP